VCATIPLDRLLIETDCPWCDVRSGHAGYHMLRPRGKEEPSSVRKEKWRRGVVVKGRSEPRDIRYAQKVTSFICVSRVRASRSVLEIVSAVTETPIEEMGEKVYKNTCDLFFR